jgi:hypothetical protein
MTDDYPQLCTVRRSVVIRLGVILGVLAALGISFAVGYAVHSPPSSETLRQTVGTTTTGVHNKIIPAHPLTTTTTTTAAPTTTTNPLRAVLAPATTPLWGLQPGLIVQARSRPFV